MPQHRRFETVLKDALKNPTFKAEWDASETQYQIIEKLISERLKRNLSQRDLAQIAGVKQPSIARIESGSVMPSMRMLTRLASALGTEIEVRFKPL